MKFLFAVLSFSALVTLGCSKPAAKRTSFSFASGGIFAWNRPASPLIKLPITQSATCKFKKSLNATFRKNVSSTFAEKYIPDDPDESERVYYFVYDEDETDTVAFVDLDTNAPKVQSNAGQTSLQVIYRDAGMLTLIHAEPSDTIVYTIFLNKGVVTLSQHKNSGIIGGPYGVLAMGYCN